jgi:copper chaperone CopZ
MKSIYFLPIFLVLFACGSNSETINQNKSISIINKTSTKNGITTAKFTVWGNCGMCKETIEKSLKILGVKKANWHIESKIMTVSFDTTLVDVISIQKAIAAVGYDNVQYTGDNSAYAKLHACCQYERK